MNRLIFLLLMSLLVASCETYREPPKGVVTLEVGLDYAYGGIQPVARQEFYLLNGNLNELLPAKMELRDLTAFVEAQQANKATTAQFWLEKNQQDREKLTNVIQAHTAAKGMTDLHGMITFAPIVPGPYYVLGWSTTRKESEVIIWNYRVDVKAGEQKISLSSSDAATVGFILPPPRRIEP